MFFKNNKKGETPVIMELFMMFVITVIFISWILTLFTIKTYDIDERKINSQIIIKNLLAKNCFSEKYATFEKDRMNLVNECFKGLNIEKTWVRFELDNNLYYVLDSREIFNEKANLCGASSSLFCTQISYPVEYIDESGEHLKELKVQIITT